MVQPVTNDIQAQNAARWIKKFRERLYVVDGERACLNAMIDELTEVLLRYREGARRAALAESEAKESDG